MRKEPILRKEERTEAEVCRTHGSNRTEIHLQASKKPSGDDQYVAICAATETTYETGGSKNPRGNRVGHPQREWEDPEVIPVIRSVVSVLRH